MGEGGIQSRVEAGSPSPDESEVHALRREVERLKLLDQRSSGLLQAILSQTPHGIIICDAAGRLILHNPAAVRIWAGSAVANNLAEWGQYRAFHPDGRPYGPGDWQMARCLTERTVNAAEEFHVQRFDGTHGTLLGSSAPIFDGEGELLGAISVFADVSHLKSVEAKLGLREEQLATILRSIGDAVIATDDRGRVTFMNAVAEALTGHPASSAADQPLEEVFRRVGESASDADTLSAPGPISVAAGSTGGAHAAFPGRTSLLRPDASRLPVDVSTAPIRAPDARVAGVVVVFRDATEKRKMEDRLQLLSDASVALLSASLEYRDRVASVAKLAVPRFSDWAAVDMVEPGGRLVRLATAHVDPRKLAAVDELARRYPEDPSSPNGLYAVVRNGTTAFVPVITDAMLAASARDPVHLEMIRALGLRSYICAPLVSRGRTLGAVTFATAESQRQYESDDVVFAEELARRAALALDNSILYETAQESLRAVEKAERRFRQLAEAIPQIVWAVSADGGHEFLGPRWYEYTGQPADTPLAESWLRAVHPDDLGPCFETWQRARASGEAWQMEYRLRRADGSYRWHVGRSVPTFEDDRVVAWYGAAADIEDQKSAIRSRDDLLATVSHDLRNPLNVVLVAAAGLRRGAQTGDIAPGRVVAQAISIERAGKRMDALIRDLLDITAIESGHLSIERGQHRVASLLAEALEAMLPLVSEKGLRIEKSLTPQAEGLLISCDRGRLLQVFENLLGNAVKFTPPGGLISVQAEADGEGGVQFSVRDSGPGIPEDQRPYIFDRFWQARRAARSGAGLGLAICKGIVERHGGRISVGSEMGVGTTLRFTIPPDSSETERVKRQDPKTPGT